MGKMDATAFLLLSVLGIAFILITFPPEGRAGAQAVTPCGSYNYASTYTCSGGCLSHCQSQAELQKMVLVRGTCSETSGTICECSCAAGAVGAPCGYPSYYNGDCNTTAPDGNCYKDCQGEAKRLNLAYGGSVCNGDVCSCLCKI